MKLPSLQFLILDYNRKEESDILLSSLMSNVRLDRSDYWITYLSNGGNQDYVLDYYNDGLIDQLIIRKQNLGAGYGFKDLSHICQSEYCILIENDQYLNGLFTEDLFNQCKNLFSQGFKSIDFAGFQAGEGVYSNRAHLVQTKEYLKWIENAPPGGPGPFNHLGYPENYLQNLFKDKKWKIANGGRLFGDFGKWSVRELPEPCCGISKHRADTKALYWIKPPKAKCEFVNLTDEEWELSISGKWIDGTIPENDKQHSFNCFGD